MGIIIDEDGLCIHLLEPETCTMCNGHDAREKAEKDPWKRFPAKYEGQCRKCHLPIYPRQMVAWREGESAVHDGCQP